MFTLARGRSGEGDEAKTGDPETKSMGLATTGDYRRRSGTLFIRYRRHTSDLSLLSYFCYGHCNVYLIKQK